MTNRQKIGILLIFISFLLILGVVPLKAQTLSEQWSVPYRLSSQQGTFGAFSNTMIADKYGFTHVFWTESGFPDGRLLLQYARFDGETWTGPVDISVVTESNAFSYISPAIDQNNVLHLVWSEDQSGPVYYASAPAHNALSAKMWQNPIRIDVPAFRLKLEVDSKGVLHLVYSKFLGNELGIYYMQSKDEGKTWSDPYRIDPDIPDNWLPWTLQFGLDDKDGLHVLWSYNEKATGTGRAIRYARSQDGGDVWSLPVAVDEEGEKNGELSTADPRLAVQGQNLHVIWNAPDGRRHIISADGGQTWGIINHQAFGRLHGQAQDALIVDPANRIHFLGQIRWPQGLYHIYWDQGRWSNPLLVYLISNGAGEDISDKIHVHNVNAAIQANNQLVVTFSNSPADPEFVLYAMHTTLDDIPLLSPIPTPTSTPTTIPTLQPEKVATIVTATPYVRPTLSAHLVEEENSPGYPLFIAILPVMGLILIVILTKQFFSH